MDLHCKLLVVCARDSSNKVVQYWWSVTPGTLHFERDEQSTTSGTLYWQLLTYDAATGREISGSAITKITMNNQWDYGTPEQNKEKAYGPSHWKMDVKNAPAGHNPSHYPYDVTFTVGGDGTPITIDPEVELDPGDDTKTAEGS